jgi:hypothetical protein
VSNDWKDYNRPISGRENWTQEGDPVSKHLISVGGRNLAEVWTAKAKKRARGLCTKLNALVQNADKFDYPTEQRASYKTPSSLWT